MKLAGLVIQLLLCGVWVSAGHAQVDASFPSRTVRIMVATGAGTTADVLARVLADKASAIWRQTVVVENRPGIAGITSVVKAPPDGHTLLLTANGHSAIGALHKDLPFDPVMDLVGAAQVGIVPLVLVVPLGLPAQSLGEVIAMARSRPGAMNFASVGLGSTSHLAGEVFKRAADVDIQHVPYRGPESLTSIVRGDTQLNFVPVSTVIDLIRGKKLRAMAVISRERIPALPEVPTFAESGLLNFSYNAWFGVLAPADTPKSILGEIGRAVEGIVGQPEIQTALSQQGIRIEFMGSESFDKVLKGDADRFGQLLSK